jgi:hypothetical protein
MWMLSGGSARQFFSNQIFRKILKVPDRKIDINANPVIWMAFLGKGRLGLC